MKNVVTLVYEDEGQEARIQAALDIVRATGGHLTAIGVSALAPVADDPIIGFGSLGGLMAEELRVQATHLARIEARLEGENTPCVVEEVAGDIASALVERAALADLVVVNTMFDGFPGEEMDGVVAALIRAGRTVLAVPAAQRGFAPGGIALVAWDGSDESDAALRGAVPLLALAEEVRIVSVERGAIKHPPELAARYLSRHGIKPEIVSIAGEGSVGEAIAAHAADVGAALIVMGGFGNPRLFESLFGGVTLHLLHHSPAPLLLAH